MPAQFLASASFTLPSRRMFVVSGNILSGVVKKGMAMKVRMNSELSLTLPIESVEIVTKKEGSELGLTTICRDAEELKFLQSLEIGGDQIEITDSHVDEKKG